MLFSSLLKTIGLKKKNQEKSTLSMKDDLRQVINDATATAKTARHNLLRNISLLRARLNNIADSNYKIGIYHLKNGHINDAIFRFRFLLYFYPTYYPAYVKLAEAYLQKKQRDKARQILMLLHAIYPEYDGYEALLKVINEA